MSLKDKVAKLYPLTPMQEGILFYSLLEERSEAYFCQFNISLHGLLDLGILEQSLTVLMERHEMLRTLISHKKLSQPLQVVLKERTPSFLFEDLTGIEESRKQERVEAFKQADRARGFDLTNDVLLRIAVLKTGEEQYEMIWSSHHIILDGWSSSILRNELFTIYEQLRNNRPLHLPAAYSYANYMGWLERQDKEEALRYWTHYLEGYEQRAEIPKSNLYYEQKNGYMLKENTYAIGEVHTEQLKALCKRNKLTLNSFMQMIWGAVLHQYSGCVDVVHGMVVSGRPSEVQGIENMVGMFISTLPVRISFASQESLLSIAQQVQADLLNSEKYNYLSLADVQAKSALKANLFDHICVFENYPVDTNLSNDVQSEEKKITITAIKAIEQTNYGLNVTMFMRGNQLVVKLSYNAEMYFEESMKRLLRHLAAIVEQVVERPDIRMDEIELVREEEKQQLAAFTDTKVEYPKDKTIHALFEEQAERTPEAEAVVFKSERLTYGELNAKANQLARTLRAHDVGPDKIVGIMAERSLEMVVGILAILKAGGAYLPIDPSYPAERITYMLTDSGTDVFLTFGCETVPAEYIGAVLDLADSRIYDANTSSLPPLSTSSHALYVIYTSGTTGTPKGVVMEHRSIVNLLDSQKRQTALEFTRTLQFAAYSFDVCAQELFSVLLSGGTLFVADEETKRNPQQLIEYIRTHKIGTVFLPTAYLKHVISDRSLCQHLLETIEHLVVAGEQLVLNDDFVQTVRHMNVLVHNHYGPTESHVVSTYTIGANNGYSLLPPIGSPITNTALYIVNRYNRLQPIGVPGELCIAGDSLARGYLNRPELTAEKFVDNPFVPGERMYRTGDLARWLPDGTIEYVGRIDHQVKIRGYRIELGEIEKQLQKHETVRETVVLALVDEQGQNALCAYVVADVELTVAELRAHVGKALPDYMIPAYFMQIERMPLTSNGKVDRKTLPKPDGSMSTGAVYEAPTNIVEEKLAAIFQDVLGIGQVGIQDNFFEMGGHSLRATRVVNQIEVKTGVRLPLKAIFAAPTVQLLAKEIEQAKAKEYVPIPQAESKEMYPMSSAQKRLYLLNQIDDAGIAYNIPAGVVIHGTLDMDRMKYALEQLTIRHEALRTSFHMQDGEPVQKIAQEVQLELEYEERIAGAE
ncbi:non-ribosomal peptide synthetase, partial [Paenibacillus fonticola]|uniref:non-ribosomal peptide synthetase n=1 Tax=Paenibacillus fonticola TaxID=379896 RepID=UPI00037A041D